MYILRVQATATAWQASRSEMLRNRLVPVGTATYMTSLTCVVPDALRDLMDVLYRLDPRARLAIPKVTHPISPDYEVLCESPLFQVHVRCLPVRGFFMNPWRYESGGYYDVIVTFDASTPTAEAAILEALTHGYAHVFLTRPVSGPPRETAPDADADAASAALE